jgi:protein SCO1/2
MRPSLKKLAAVLWGLVVIGLTGLLLLYATSSTRIAHVHASDSDIPLEQGLPVLFDVPSFQLVNQDGKSFTDRDLRGNPYVAMIFFTRCTGPCPMMNGKMSSLQSSGLDPRVRLVSFSLDPENDTPAVLRQHAREYNADLSRWTFLTGTRPQMFAAAAGLRLAAQQDRPGAEITHSAQFVLVDGQGRARGVYESGSQADLERLVREASMLFPGE